MTRTRRRGIIREGVKRKELIRWEKNWNRQVNCGKKGNTHELEIDVKYVQPLIICHMSYFQKRISGKNLFSMFMFTYCKNNHFLSKTIPFCRFSSNWWKRPRDSFIDYFNEETQFKNKNHINKLFSLIN